MTIIDKLKKTIEACKVPFLYHAVGDMNTMLDDVDIHEKIVSISFPLSTSTPTDEMGVVRERANFAVSFVTEGTADANSLKNEERIDRCKQKAFEWLTRLKRDSDLILVSANRAERIYDRFDCEVTGYMVEVTIEEMDGIAACDL